ncbi:hypothetical protein D3H55_04735 [Bacillus salacetis]|uniref:Uncharacterized protein n=1 Tax=Bacillus salacetis TaxID=2315464 RepID=A0A3A1R4Q0_9BACI|nr:hypothetical protein [Bacillus salacetis]RIW37347.1 hypothetical protein D3H55_04735 [Bacillus salacetis]
MKVYRKYYVKKAKGESELEKQREVIDTINDKQKALTNDWNEYWHDYSAYDTWQFWFLILLFIIPLVVLYFKLDKRRALQLGFFGFNIHVWLGYIDRFGASQGYWEYPYQWLIILPSNVTLDASLIPVIYILLYQWILTNKKNFYLYMILLSAGLSFIFKPLLVLHYFLTFYIKMPYIYLFIGYLVIIWLSKMITDIFLGFYKKTE